MGVCDSLIKVLLIIFNTICVICGIAIIAVGGVLLANGGNFGDVINDVDSGFQAPQITLIVLGCIIFVIAFLGCCGSIKESKCMLITYAVFLILIFLVQLAIGIYAAATFSQGSVNTVVRNLFEKQDADSKAMFHDMEIALKCCGVQGPVDYNLNQLPPSCFEDQNTGNGSPFWEGCTQALDEWLTSAGKILAGVAIGLGVVEILCAGFAIFQAKKINHLY